MFLCVTQKTDIMRLNRSHNMRTKIDIVKLIFFFAYLFCLRLFGELGFELINFFFLPSFLVWTSQHWISKHKTRHHWSCRGRARTGQQLQARHAANTEEKWFGEETQQQWNRQLNQQGVVGSCSRRRWYNFGERTREWEGGRAHRKWRQQ